MITTTISYKYFNLTTIRDHGESISPTRVQRIRIPLIKTTIANVVFLRN